MRKRIFSKYDYMRAIALTLFGLTSIISSSSTFAIPINLDTGVSSIAVDVEVPCGTHASCGVAGHLSTTSISFGSNLYFTDGFNAWNNAQAAGSKWTLANGGTITGASLDIEIFRAESDHANHLGGVEIQIDFNYTGSDRDDFLWSQGLKLNYDPPGTDIIPSFSTMDDNTLSNFACDTNAAKGVFGAADPDIWCGPAYPFQYTNEKFYDFPMAPYETGMFEADAMLSKIDYTNRILTIFEGVHYGFSLSSTPVPLPSTLILIISGLLVMLRTDGIVKRHK